MTSFSSGAGGETHHRQRLSLLLGFALRSLPVGSPPTRGGKRSTTARPPVMGVEVSPPANHQAAASNLPTKKPSSPEAPTASWGLARGAGFEPRAGASGLALSLSSSSATGVSHRHQLGRAFLPEFCPLEASLCGCCRPHPPAARDLSAGGWVPGCPRSVCSEPQGKLHEQRVSLG